MSTHKVSIIVPARNERHLQRTIDSLLTNAAGDVEILVVLDGGPWPNPPLRTDKRVIVLRRNDPRGMRPAINDAAQVASGKYLMKCDAHCIFGEGYDAILKADCEDDWLVVPTRHSIDGEAWEQKGEKSALRPRHWNYTTLTYPFCVSMYGAGLHAVTFPWDQNKTVNAARQDIIVDDLMSFQGSCWFQPTKNFLRLGPLDHDHYYFYGEAVELSMRTWVTGGRCAIHKGTWYAHWHKGKDSIGADGRKGRGFYLDLRKKRLSEAYGTDYWLNNRWPGATRTFVSIIEQFWPLIAEMKDPRYAWPADWRDFEGHRRAFENRAPGEIPLHT